MTARRWRRGEGSAGLQTGIARTRETRTDDAAYRQTEHAVLLHVASGVQRVLGK